MVSSLIEHERIVTTVAKAKEMQNLAEKMVTLAKASSPEKQLHNRRRAMEVVRGPWNVAKLFDILGPRYKFREGGYTRIMKLSKNRAGDNAPMAVIEYVDRPGEIRAARPPRKLQQAAANGGIESVLRELGIPPVDELITKEEKAELEHQIKG